jgi:hypothetical protein
LFFNVQTLNDSHFYVYQDDTSANFLDFDDTYLPVVLSDNDDFNFESSTNTPLFNPSKRPTFRFKKTRLSNIITPIRNVVAVQKPLHYDNSMKKYYKFLLAFFKKLPRNPVLNRKSTKYVTYLLVYFLLTHDLEFFSTQLTKFLNNTPRRFQLKLLRYLTLLNRREYRSVFYHCNIHGVYFKISGKFGGVGGSKKMKKHFV